MTTIDWGQVSAWAAGVATVIASVAIAIWQAIKKATTIRDTLPPPINKTDIYTTDTTAMERLQTAIDANTLILTELLKIGRDFTDQIRHDREEAAIEEEVSRRVEAREEARRELDRAKRRQSAARKRALK